MMETADVEFMMNCLCVIYWVLLLRNEEW